LERFVLVVMMIALSKGGILAERTIRVCDVCGEPAVETVAIKAGGRSLNKDVCQVHLAELTSGARSARRGRPRKLGTAKSPRKRVSKAKTKAPRKTSPRRGSRKAATEPA
jgi:hypothetical protein